MRDFECELREETGSDGLVFDSVTHESCPDWTDAHVDAVLGEVISPLAWTVVGPAFEWSQARMWAAFGVVPSTRDRRSRFAARLNGRLHIGLTTLRRAGVRFPGVDAARTERELGLPPSSTTKSWRDRAWYPVAAAGLSTVSFRAPLWVRRQRRLVARNLRRDCDASAPPEALVTHLEMLRHELVPVLQAHAFVRMATHASIERLRSHAGEDELAFALLADLPGLEASQPSLALLAMAVAARATGVVDQAALDDFVARFGHRGVNELDPTAPVWADQRTDLEDAVARLALQDIDDPRDAATAKHADARRQVAGLGRVRRTQLLADAHVARRLSLLGERSKNDAARQVHVLRRHLAALRRGIDIDPDLHSMLSWAELRQLSTAGGTLDADLAQRCVELQRAAGRPAAPSVAVPRHRTLTGVAASPGVGSGIAVVVDNPTAPNVDGDILVAHATDTAWTPLFLGRAGIITDTGGVLSHSSIVARDLGIPAVVGVEHATTMIRTGDNTDVDGNTGVVRVAN